MKARFLFELIIVLFKSLHRMVHARKNLAQIESIFNLQIIYKGIL